MLSLNSLFKDHGIERQIGDSLTEPKILFLQHLQSPCLIDLQAAILAAPSIVGLLGNAEGPADRLGLLAIMCSFRRKTAKNSNFQTGPVFGGQVKNAAMVRLAH